MGDENNKYLSTYDKYLLTINLIHDILVLKRCLALTGKDNKMKEKINFLIGILKKILYFFAGILSSIIWRNLPYELLVSGGDAERVYIITLIIAVTISLLMIRNKKTRFFGIGFIIIPGFFCLLYAFAYFILWILGFGNWY